MKKILMTLVAIVVAMSANAQVYVGGEVSINSVDQQISKGHSETQTSFKVLPEIGYNFNETWAVGAGIGYQKGVVSAFGTDYKFNDDSNSFSFEPYARWTFFNSQYVDVFLQFGFGVMSGKLNDHDFSAFYVGAQPGLAINLNEHWAFITKFGYLGYEEFNPDGDYNNTHHFGLGLNGNTLSIGVNYKF